MTGFYGPLDKALCRYMDREDVGMVPGYGCGTRSSIEASSYPKEAYELGQKVRIS